jgi:hypothetical protein
MYFHQYLYGSGKSLVLTNNEHYCPVADELFSSSWRINLDRHIQQRHVPEGCTPPEETLIRTVIQHRRSASAGVVFYKCNEL